jgi:hypothetical protein
MRRRAPRGSLTSTTYALSPSWTRTGRRGLAADGYWLEFEVDRSRRRSSLIESCGTRALRTASIRRAPEPEGVSQAEASKFSDRSIARRRREQQQQVAWYRSLSLADQLRLIQQDDALADRHRGDLKVIARRIEAMWNKGKAA